MGEIVLRNCPVLRQYVIDKYCRIVQNGKPCASIEKRQSCEVAVVEYYPD